MELTFPIEAPIVLYFLFVGRVVLIMEQCLAVAEWCLHIIKAVSSNPMLVKGHQAGKKLGLWDSCLKLAKGIFHNMTSCSELKVKWGWVSGGGRNVIGVFDFTRYCTCYWCICLLKQLLCIEVILPCKQLDIVCWWKVENKSFFLPCAAFAVFIEVSLSWPIVLIFSLFVEGDERTAW